MIEEAWKSYEAKVVPASAPQVQRVESKRAFYAGAATLLYGLVGGVEPGTSEPTPADMSFITSVKAELDAFYQAEEKRTHVEVAPGVELHPRRPSMGQLEAHCQRAGCGKPTRWQVALDVFAPGFAGPRQGMRFEFPIALCDECGKASTPDDFLTDEGFARISEVIKGIGKLPPERGLTKLQLLPILMGRA
jgi:hypothetical protein